jgi:hypothetical protein
VLPWLVGVVGAVTWRDVAALTVVVSIVRWGLGWPGELAGSRLDLGGPDDHHHPWLALVRPEPAVTESERLALAGLLDCYSGLTREAYMLDPTDRVIQGDHFRPFLSATE